MIEMPFQTQYVERLFPAAAAHHKDLAWRLVHHTSLELLQSVIEPAQTQAIIFVDDLGSEIHIPGTILVHHNAMRLRWFGRG